MLSKKLKDHHLILASASPRRQQILRDLGLDFKVRLKPVEEVYPQSLMGTEIPDYLSKLKAEAFSGLKPNEILITGDTVVALGLPDGQAGAEILGKPKDEAEARRMLRSLSGKSHEVISSVCLRSDRKMEVAHDITKVYFKKLTEEEIDYYLKNFKPFDKAGAYGIQEWIGQIGIAKIEGSYFTVMGMPVHLLYKMLLGFIDNSSSIEKSV